MIDLVALRSLTTLSTTGSVGAAAESLGFTPSAVSQQIKRLERQVGDHLLERVGRGVVLTQQGRLLVQRGAPLLADVEALESSLRADDDVRGTLRLVTFASGLRGIVAQVAAAAHARHPDLQITVTERDPWEAVDLLAEGRMDLAVVHNWTRVPLAVPSHVDAQHLMRDRADVLLPHDHRLVQLPEVTPVVLGDIPWIATSPSTICHEWLLRMYDGTGQAPNVVHTVGEFQSQVALVQAGLGAAIMPRLGRGPLPPQVVSVPAVDPEPVRDITVLWRRSMDGSPAVRAVVRLLLERSERLYEPVEQTAQNKAFASD